MFPSVDGMLPVSSFLINISLLRRAPVRTVVTSHRITPQNVQVPHSREQ
jgi:hypothetical protein